MTIKITERLPTERQQQFYRYILATIQKKGRPPTLREMGRHFRIGSPNGVLVTLKRLEKRRYILRAKQRARNIILCGVRWEPVFAPTEYGARLKRLYEDSRGEHAEKGLDRALGLTRQQSRILGYIMQCMLGSGMPPTVRQMMGYFDLAGPNSVMCHIRPLRQKGWLLHSPERARSFLLNGASWEPVFLDDRAGTRARALYLGNN